MHLRGSLVTAFSHMQPVPAGQHASETVTCRQQLSIGSSSTCAAAAASNVSVSRSSNCAVAFIQLKGSFQFSATMLRASSAVTTASTASTTPLRAYPQKIFRELRRQHQ
jgi:hypothetical protein